MMIVFGIICGVVGMVLGSVVTYVVFQKRYNKMKESIAKYIDEVTRLTNIIKSEFPNLEDEDGPGEV